MWILIEKGKGGKSSNWPCLDFVLSEIHVLHSLKDDIRGKKIICGYMLNQHFTDSINKNASKKEVNTSKVILFVLDFLLLIEF